MANIPLADFTLPATGGVPFTLSTHRGTPLVLYFYPKDNTPGCTTEAQQFRDLHPAFREANARIFGVSRDSLRSHEGFKAKLDLPFELLSDPDEQACMKFDVIREKLMYGKVVRGIERSTFVLDGDGRIVREWRKVKALGHAAEVLDFIRSIH